MEFEKIKLILSILPKISLIKTLYYCFKFKCHILVGRGAKIILSENSKIIVKGNLFIGLIYNWNQRTVLEIGKNGTLIVEGSASLMKGSKTVISENATLKVCHNSSIGENSFIKCRKKIEIGENCAISWNVTIIDSDLHQIIIDGNNQENTKEIMINNNVLIGCNSTILKGVKIGESSVVGAGTVVSKSIPPNSLSVGNPNRIAKQNVKWEP